MDECIWRFSPDAGLGRKAPTDRRRVHLRRLAGLGMHEGSRLILRLVRSMLERLGLKLPDETFVDATSARNLAICPYRPFSIAKQLHHRPTFVLMGPAQAVRGVRADALENGVAELYAATDSRGLMTE